MVIVGGDRAGGTGCRQWKVAAIHELGLVEWDWDWEGRREKGLSRKGRAGEKI